VCSSGKQLNSHDARCSKIVDGLTKAKYYRAAYPGMKNTDIIIKIKTRITSLLEGIASEGTNALDSALARLEEDMKEHDLATPELTTAQGHSEQLVQCEWDDHRQDHYYWMAEGYFQYHKGGRVRPDDTPYGEVGEDSCSWRIEWYVVYRKTAESAWMKHVA
jgi:hypothetical protein